MIITRRGFLQGILAAGVMPAILPSGIIMPIRPSLVLPGTAAFTEAQLPAGTVLITDSWPLPWAQGYQVGDRVYDVGFFRKGVIIPKGHVASMSEFDHTLDQLVFYPRVVGSNDVNPLTYMLSSAEAEATMERWKGLPARKRLRSFILEST